MIQNRVKLAEDTLIRCKLYCLLYAMRKELQNEVDSMLEMGSHETIEVRLRKKIVLTWCVLNLEIR